MTFTQNDKMIRDLGLYESFIAVADHSSITAAAKALTRSVQAVSRDLAQLEADLGVSLVARTTRRLQLTAAGRIFYDRLKPLLADLELAQDESRMAASTIAGSVRIAGPSLFGPHVLTPIISEFLMRHPEVSITLTLTDKFIDPTVSGADITVRIGESPDSRLIARKLGEVRMVAFASPAYLAAHGRPKSPKDLRDHNCVVRRGEHESARWSFRVGGDTEIVTVGGRFETDSVAAAIEAVAQGLGIGVAAYWQVRELIDQGRVEVLLSDCEPPPKQLQAMWLSSLHLPARTRLFVEFLSNRLAGRRL